MRQNFRGSIKVIEPGLQSTVQDLGRPGYGHLGISPSGAADKLSLLLGNRILKNEDHCAALELTMTGATFEFLKSLKVAFTGAQVQILLNGSPAPFLSSFEVHTRDVIEISAPVNGARTYLSVGGGIDVPLFLESRSTHLASKLGGLHGRSLVSGDILKTGHPAVSQAPSEFTGQLQKKSTAFFESNNLRKSLRATRGLHFSLFNKKSQNLITSQNFLVTPACSRQGLKLTGKTLEDGPKEELASIGVSLGTVQVSSDGMPMILFVEQQTTGGYPQILTVISADHPCLGQLRPGDNVSFELIETKQAEKILREQREKFEELVCV